jgi:hypothetical protein
MNSLGQPGSFFLMISLASMSFCTARATVSVEMPKALAISRWLLVHRPSVFPAHRQMYM